MKYFAAFSPMLDEGKSQKYRPDHLDYLEKLGKEGKVFAKGRFADGTGGMVIYMAENYDEVEAIVKNDPYVVQGARGYEIHEWVMTTDAVLPEK
ncbi:YciI family protein [Oceanobacillus saliphilus]|uniref:YciI family protein n=1 Tax=Oceanobacillus saliphilus TaxID=2925834 RepID=UPI00201D96F7|nr:YciI family protein [Oceanobacillus saliphilus]